ncbi:hypothetical protein BH09ACT6_BH09ACT6_03140 [soil metagenome]
MMKQWVRTRSVDTNLLAAIRFRPVAPPERERAACSRQWLPWGAMYYSQRHETSQRCQSMNPFVTGGDATHSG